MRFGASAYILDSGIDPVTCARALEDAGLESFWVGEHSHIPTSELGPHQSSTPGSLTAAAVARSLDPYVVLSAAAAVTTKLKVGTSVTLVAQRDTIQTAKQVASLDFMSGGRFIFSVGAGWNVRELRNHGVDPATRFEKMREQIEAMTEIWTKERAAYKGDYVQFEELWAWPKPLQKPRPPVFIGSHVPNSLDAVLSWADGWSLKYGDEQQSRIPELQERAATAGRGTIPVMVGNVPEDREVIEELLEVQGIERLIFAVSSEENADRVREPLSADDTLRKIERVAELVSPYA